MSSSPLPEPRSEPPSDVVFERASLPGEARSGSKNQIAGSPLLLLAVLAALWRPCWRGDSESRGSAQFRPEIANLNMMGHAYRDASPQTREIAMLKGATCVLGSLGRSESGDGSHRRAGESSFRRTVIAMGVGLLVGGIAGALPVWFAVPAYNRAKELTAGELGRSLLLHWAMWTELVRRSGLPWV